MSLTADSQWSRVIGGITTPKGFQASAIRAGFKPSNKEDLALLLAPTGAVCAGTFTQSLVRASCIDLCQKRIQSCGGNVRAVLINSGHANACTGDLGLRDSLVATEAVANYLDLLAEEVLICSTGVIGVPIPMDKLLESLKPLVENLSFEGGTAASRAILTTDLVQKEIAFEAYCGGRRVCIGGMAKGSGMIHPNMATMLAYITCDAKLPPDVWQAFLERAVNSSFNAITVDGDTSTNDSVIAFAAGELLDKEYWETIELGLTAVSQYLAKAIARDGEGANCLLEVKVDGAQSFEDARHIARTICSSSLVKTAINGCDPNWGRIVAAAGRANVIFDSKLLEVSLGPFKLMSGGNPIDFDRALISAYMKERMNGSYLLQDSICIQVKVGSGIASASVWGCDMSAEYVRINADYTT